MNTEQLSRTAADNAPIMNSSPNLSIGERVFGGYVVSDKLGEGGMGVVYAIANEALNRKLALKLLLPQWSHAPQIVQRFLAEARAASAIRHPNIIEIIDASQLANGAHYMLMEFLEGDCLEKFLRERGPVSVDTALIILSQVCSGLQAAHDRGIIHRDLKPANLFVSPTPTNPLFTKILDFGIAKLTDPELAGDLRTMTNTVIGTPSYMSPEQARGAKDIDHRTDIYALAVIAYELLGGALPYAASSLGDLVYKQATAPPRDVRELRADLPPGWSNAIMSALSVDPAERPQSAREFLELLEAATPNANTSSTVWLAEPEAPRRKRRWMLPVAMVAMFALGGVGLGVWQSQRSAPVANAQPEADDEPAAKPLVVPRPHSDEPRPHSDEPRPHSDEPRPHSDEPQQEPTATPTLLLYRHEVVAARDAGTSVQPRRRRAKRPGERKRARRGPKPSANKTSPPSVTKPKPKPAPAPKPKPPTKPRAFDPDDIGG